MNKKRGVVDYSVKRGWGGGGGRTWRKSVGARGDEKKFIRGWRLGMNKEKTPALCREGYRGKT